MGLKLSVTLEIQILLLVRGSSLTTYFHAELFGARKKRLILNLGGIANITLLDRGTILGTDIGPANALIDIYCQKKLGIKFDKNGKLASKEKLIMLALNQC